MKDVPLTENRGGYEAAGVSIERGERTVDLLRHAVESTHGPEVLGVPGGFAGLFTLAGYRDPVLASTIAGVGIVSGAAEACGRLGVALIGGETAEMPGIYGQGDFEIVGVCVGACERSEVVSGERVRPGDAVLGLASSGLHTNGYTLARKVLADA